MFLLLGPAQICLAYAYWLSAAGKDVHAQTLEKVSFRIQTSNPRHDISANKFRLAAHSYSRWLSLDGISFSLNCWWPSISHFHFPLAI